MFPRVSSARRLLSVLAAHVSQPLRACSCDDTSKVASTGFTPHLSVGQFGRKKALAAVGEINAAWQSPQDCQAQPSSPQPPAAASSHGWSRKPLGSVLACDAGSGVSWLVTHVFIISRASFSDPFHVRFRVPLGKYSLVLHARSKLISPVPQVAEPQSGWWKAQRRTG